MPLLFARAGAAGARDFLLPPAVAGWPAALTRGEGFPAAAPEGLPAALTRIRAEGLFWPAPRARAARPRVLAIGAAGFDAARAAFAEAEVAATDDPAAIDPERLEAVFGAGPPALWARIGGLLAPDCDEDPAALLAAARGVSPWTGERLSLGDAVEAQALLRDAAMRARGPVGLVGMSPWKRGCLRPFLTGPDGPPQAARSAAEARARGWRPVLWGAAEGGAGAEDALRVEDGFLRSVGLGLRHTPPLSLAIDALPPHFDATRPNGFEAVVAAAAFTPGLLGRARRLRERIAALGLTKYNLAGGGSLPEALGREAVLAAGQVESDASIRLGARAIRTDLALLEAARARWPDALIVYKPHPDVLTGLRPGGAPAAAAAALGVHVAAGVATTAALAWADRVATMTSLIGFEALLRGKAVSTFGRPFYAGWGLTDDADPPPRSRRLSLDELVAAALILYPRYIDPATGLPCPPEIALDALVRERAAAGRPAARLRRLWRDAASWILARI